MEFLGEMSVGMMNTDFSKIVEMRRYAQADAVAAGLSSPVKNGLEGLVDFMSEAGNILFLPGDPNLDNVKRNIAIRVFLTFDMTEIVSFGNSWLARWNQNADVLWHREWVDIVGRADHVELTDILLSHKPDRVRQRLSMPFSEMLNFDQVLNIKRKGRREEV